MRRRPARQDALMNDDDQAPEDAQLAETPHPEDPDAEPRVVLNLDDNEPEPTGDPLVDRGLEFTIAESEEILKDPNHPDYAAVKAAQDHFRERFSGMFTAVYGSQFQRIAENIASAARPSLDDLAQRLFPLSQSPDRPPLSELFDRLRETAVVRDDVFGSPQVEPPLLEPPQVGPDETLERMLAALVDMNERTSEMVRVLSEQLDLARAEQAAAQRERDEAQRDRDDARDERDVARASAADALKHTKRANVAAWVGAIVGAAALIISVLLGGG